MSENGFVIFTLLKSRGLPWSPVVLLVLSRCPPLFLVVCCVICAIPLSPVVPVARVSHSLACSLSVLASVVVFGVLLMPLVRVGSLVCWLVRGS